MVYLVCTSMVPDIWYTGFSLLAAQSLLDFGANLDLTTSRCTTRHEDPTAVDGLGFSHGPGEGCSNSKLHLLRQYMLGLLAVCAPVPVVSVYPGIPLLICQQI